MGRVHDAMQRSGEADFRAADLPADLDLLASEIFPDEESAASEPAAEAAIAADFPPDAFPDASADRTEDAPGGVLFDRLDATLESKVVVDDRTIPMSREQYRRLAAALHHAQQANGVKVVMVSSALAGEGKTLTATNLALTLSESYQRNVLLIDGDLRRPSLHTVFKIDDAVGLGGLLFSPDDFKATLHPVSDRLAVLPAGKPTSDPMAGLTSDRMRRLIDGARETFDWVIIDTPPVGVLTDAHLLGAMVDASLIVVKADVTPYQVVARAVDVLGRDRTLGIVLNRATAASETSSYDYYSYYYDGTRRASG